MARPRGVEPLTF